MKAFLASIFTILMHVGFGQVELLQTFNGDIFFRDFVEYEGSFYGFQVTSSSAKLVKIDSDGSQTETLEDLISGEEPQSLLISDDNIYFTVNINTWQSRLYKFNLQTSALSVLKNFTSEEGEIVSIKHATDTVLWGFSWRTSEDEGNIFVIKPDGSEFEKIYSAPNSDNGSTPVDIELYDDKVVIAWVNGGGIPYQDSSGDFYTSGSFGVYDLKSKTHTTILQGEDLKGTSPYSILYHDGIIYAAFAEAGNSSYGKLYTIDSETFDSDLIFDFPKDDLVRIGFDKLIYSDGFIYGIERFGIFRYNISEGVAELTFDLLAADYETNSALFISSTGDIFTFVTRLFQDDFRYLARMVFPLGLDDSNEPIIFPNPVGSSFEVTDPDIDMVEITDLKGSVINSMPVLNSQVDVSELTPGNYLVRFNLGERSYIRKLVKR